MTAQDPGPSPLQKSPAGAQPTAYMWETVARPGQVDALVDWARGVLPDPAATPNLLRAELYRSDERVVVITLWSGQPSPLPDAPAGLVTRAPMAWKFDQVVG